MTQENKTPAVYAAIGKAITEAAQIALPWIDGGGGKTKGRKSEDLMVLMVQVLTSCKLVIIPAENILEPVRVEKTSSGSSMYHQTINKKFIVASTEDGSTVEGWGAGTGMDMGDKYTSKAQTYAIKSFLMQLLMIPSREMTEDEITPTRISAEQVKYLQELIELKKTHFDSKESKFYDYLRSHFKISDLEAITTAIFGDIDAMLVTPPRGKEWPEGLVLPKLPNS